MNPFHSSGVGGRSVRCQVYLVKVHAPNISHREVLNADVNDAGPSAPGRVAHAMVKWLAVGLATFLWRRRNSNGLTTYLLWGTGILVTRMI